MLKATLSAAAPALLSGTGTTSSFDAAAVVKDMMDTAQAQMLSIVGIVAVAVAAVTLAVVAVKFGSKWIRRLGNA